MRFFHFIAVFIITCIAASTAQADSIIELPEYTISYHSGDIDPKTLNGNARDVVIRQKSRHGGSVLIDDYTFSSNTDGTTTIIDNLVLNGLTILAEDQVKISIESMTWTNGQVNGNWMALIISDVHDHDVFFSNLGKVTINDIMGSKSGETIFRIDSIHANSQKMANNPYDDIPIIDINFDFRNIDIPTTSIHNDHIIARMKNLGLDGIKLNIAVVGKNILMDDRINSNVTLFIKAEEMAEIRLAFGMGISDSLLSEINSEISTGDVEFANIDMLIQDTLLELMTSGAFFNSMDLIISDKGILDILVDDFAAQNGVNRDQAVSLMMDRVATSIGLMVPNTYRKIAPPLRSFLSEGGTIHLGLNPSQPLPVSSLLGIVPIPDQAKDLLNLSINHSK